MTLEVSRNSGSSWSAACFPSFEAEHGYTLYDMGGDAFVNVDHSDTRDPIKAGQPIGVLYHADADDKLFSLSRRDVLLQPNGLSDFMPVGGLSGVALANSIDSALWTDPAFLTGATTAYSAVQSVISRDTGANWAPLPTPSPLAGQAACSGDAAACALQVHGPDAAWRANISYPGAWARCCRVRTSRPDCLLPRRSLRQQRRAGRTVEHRQRWPPPVVRTVRRAHILVAGRRRQLGRGGAERAHLRARRVRELAGHGGCGALR